MGTTCTPTSPGCPYEAACATSDKTHAESCINFCVPIFDGAVVDDSVHCALDECDEALFLDPSFEIWRCPPTNTAGQQYVCVPSSTTPDPSRIGVCRTANGILDSCDPLDPEACESGSYCADVSECPRRRDDADRLRLPPDEDFCWLPAREGHPCDSNLGRGPHGCAPCEWGTWCRDTVGYGPLCLRACATPDAPETARPELCACARPDPCAVYADVAPPDPMFPVGAGEPAVYCSPPLVQNGDACDPQGRPCDDVLSSCQETVRPLTGRQNICCRDDGSPCTQASHCCEGRSVCVGGVCSPCGTEGDDVQSAGCCPGYAPVEGVCRSCASSREGRADARLDGASCQGDFVQLENEDLQQETFAVPLGGNTGAGPAEMPLTSGRIERVRYQLPDTHRLFLIEGDLTGSWSRAPGTDQHPPTYLASAAGPWPEAGVTVGHRYVHLPPPFPGAGVRTETTASITDSSGAAVPPSTWQSLRVYDAGACSAFQDWSVLTDLIVAPLNRFLTIPQIGIFGSDPLTLLGAAVDDLDQRAHITPILASGGGELGRASEQDQVGFFVGYRAVDGEGFGCPAATLWFSAGIRVRRDAATVPTLATEDRDRELTELHDFINDGSFCVDGDCSYCMGAGECPETCTVDGDRYRCVFYLLEEEASFEHVEPRHVRALRDAFDFRPQLVYLDGGVVGCGWAGLNDLFTSILTGQIGQFLPGVFSQLTGQFAVRLPDPALGVTFEDLADCGRTLASGELVPSDALCADTPAPLFGNRRLRCVGFDADRVRQSAPELITSYRCADLIPEVRRVNFRPDGVEIVLSDSPTDPQHRLISTDARLRRFCAADRPGTLPPDAPTVARFVNRAFSLMSGLAPPQRRICHPDDPLTPTASGGFTGCRGICGDIGVPCISIGGVRNVPDGSRCYSARTGPRQHTSFCCHPSSFCPIPASAGGTRFFPDPVAAGDPPAFWSCVDLNTNELACGACGVSCAAGQLCCGAACTDPSTDPSNCGDCGTVCGGGAACIDGTCCAPGEVVCAGACTDTSTHPGHCGGCDQPCDFGESCSLGLCCPTGQLNCGGTCRDVRADANNCGACGQLCPFPRLCINGTCCARGTEDCEGDGICNELLSDPDNCGACGNRCGFGSVCLRGRCL